MTALPSTFALRRDMDSAQEIAKSALSRQFDAGERFGYGRGVNRGIGIGMAYGICFGVVLAVLATPFLMRFV